MEVFNHHLYEYEKGLRNLILHTCPIDKLDPMIFKLKRRSIDFEVYRIKNGNVNLFFGSNNCVEVIRNLGVENLSTLSHEKDFILGIMLGYDREKQCERYLNRKKRVEVKELIG